MPPSIAVTVIVPMRNEEQRIGACLDSILATQMLPGELEILVVDGMSSDRSRAIVEERGKRFDCIRLLSNPAQIVATALNIGIRQARGRVIVIMGAHAEYPRNYLTSCLRELERTGADAVGGTLKTLPGSDTVIARAIAFMAQHSFGVGRSRFRTRDGGAYVDTVPYGAYRREVFESVGLFNEKLVRNQDFEFNARLRGAGGRLYLSTDIETAYYNVPDFTHLVKQAFNNGLWLARMWRSSAASFRLRHVVPMTFVTLLLGSLALTPLWELAAVPAVLAMAFYAIAATLAATQIARLQGGIFFFPLLALFFTQHVVYGFGTLAGLLGGVIPFSSWHFHPSPQQPA